MLLQFIQQYGGIVSLLVLLAGSGVLLRRGTAVKGIDVQDKVIAAFEVSEKLNAQKEVALVAQVADLVKERDAFKAQLETERRVFQEVLAEAAQDAKREKEAWIKERGIWMKEKATFQAQIKHLETEVAELRRQVADVTGDVP